MTTKQALLNVIEQLKEQQLIEVLQYIEHLSPPQKSTFHAKTDRSVDPLSEFIDAVDCGSLAANLDNEL